MLTLNVKRRSSSHQSTATTPVAIRTVVFLLMMVSIMMIGTCAASQAYGEDDNIDIRNSKERMDHLQEVRVFMYLTKSRSIIRLCQQCGVCSCVFVRVYYHSFLIDHNFTSLESNRIESNLTADPISCFLSLFVLSVGK